jgi:hypothetical protein
MWLDKVSDKMGAAFCDIIGDSKRAALIRGQLDENPKGSDVIVVGRVPGRIRPRGSDYRPVRYQNGRLGLQSKVGDSWEDVLCYDDGFDDYGRLDAGRWVRLSETCRWNKFELDQIRSGLMGIVREPEVI